MSVPTVEHSFVEVAGVRVFYRAAGPSGAPILLLLHGFPSASHQFRRLIDALGDRYRLIAPDYPGFGYTEAPAGFRYTFERIAEVIEGFVDRLGLDRFVLYLFDLGAPVGFRLAARRPQWIAGLIVQNANAYDEGLTPMARGMISNAAPAGMLSLAATRHQYEGGVADPGLIAPDSWTLDQHFLELPGRDEIQLELHADHPSTVEQYPVWQEWLRRHQPPTLVLWGRHDGFFAEAGAHAYRRDLPGAELHLFDTGHFALETHLPEIAPLIADFLDRV